MLGLVIDLRNALLRAIRDEDGQGLTEYALILAFVAVVAIAALVLLGGDISSFLSSVAGRV
jgi:pilus assembly protein Flp/PilA